ncbi:MAG: hypothetical protein KGP12_05915 [Actinomycetales bacterium]|nr:hypothetical protein [Actinomycetales bacterium]
MPETTISTPEHAPAITRMTLGITSARETTAPSVIACMCGACMCSASDDE